MTFFTNSNNPIVYGGTFTNQINVILEGQNDILRKHVALGALHNSAERFDPPKCHPHTREAVLKRIMQWLDDPSNQAQIMWIFGPAGAGKSAIAQSIADLCFKSDNLAASFFFSRNSAGRDKPTRFITTLAYQLSCAIPDIQAAVAKAVNDDPLLLSRSLDAQAYGLITRPLNDAVLTDSKNVLKSRPRVVIIDGLDECGKPKDQRYLLEILLTTVKQLSYPLLFLVASRPEQVIRDAFNREPLRALTTRLALDDGYKADQDIIIFLRSKFNDIKQNHPAGGDLPNPWPSKGEFNKLVKKSSGQFIYASTVINFVDSSNHLPQDRLDIVFGLAPPEITTPFAELDTLYHQIFSSVVDIEKALEILIVLLLFKDLPPRPSLLDRFLSYKPGSTRTILSDLHSILHLPPTLEEKEGKIKIMHASLSDFLLDPHRSGSFFIDSGAGHYAMTRHILKFIPKKDMRLNTRTLAISKLDAGRRLLNACYFALPTFCAQTTIFPGPELLADLFSFDFLQYVTWYNAWPGGRVLENVEEAATLFEWMELKLHSDYDEDLFHHHVQAIDTWILNQIESWFVPHDSIMTATSVSFLSFPRLDRRRVHDGISTYSDMLMTISELRQSDCEVDSHSPLTQLHFHVNKSGSPAFDILLGKFIADPARRNEQYLLDGEKCARLAKTLWIAVLPGKVRKTLEPKQLSVEVTFYNTFDSTRFIIADEAALVLLPKILPKVSEASSDTLNKFLQVVQDHPLLNYVDPADGMYDLYKAAAESAEKHLGPAFELLGERRARREREALRVATDEP